MERRSREPAKMSTPRAIEPECAAADPELDDMAQRLREVGILLDEVAADPSAYVCKFDSIA